MFGRLAQDGHKVHVVLPSEGPLVSQLQQRGIEVHVYPPLTIVDRQGFGILRGKVNLILGFPRSVLHLMAYIARHRIHTDVFSLESAYDSFLHILTHHESIKPVSVSTSGPLLDLEEPRG